MTAITGATAVVTGGQRGLGHEIATQLLTRGAAKVYVTARHPKANDDSHLIPVAVDVTDPASIVSLAAAASDANIVVNNAGLFSTMTFFDDADLADAHALFATNFFGPLAVMQAFTPVLKANGGGAFVNINSLGAWAAGQDAYNASKAALWSATNSMRLLVKEQGTQVLSVHVGPIDTEMTRALDVPKVSPVFVAGKVLDALESGDSEVLVDDLTRSYKAILSGPVEGLTFTL
jgi:NAD(P)-dependent dehydrogenase (short-subunit alcohol dehydrogenase family)